MQVLDLVELHDFLDELISSDKIVLGAHFFEFLLQFTLTDWRDVGPREDTGEKTLEQRSVL
jgi:FMN-dependent NADH-azoreductase